MRTATVRYDTSARLLAAAIEVFVEVGYRAATLRAICQRAGTNNAAINYHFRDKEHLYLAVIDYAVEQMQYHVPRVCPILQPLRRSDCGVLFTPC